MLSEHFMLLTTYMLSEHFMLLTTYICVNFTTTLLQTDLKFFCRLFFRGQIGEMSDGAGSGVYGRSKLHERTLLKCFLQNEPN